MRRWRRCLATTTRAPIRRAPDRLGCGAAGLQNKRGELNKDEENAERARAKSANGSPAARALGKLAACDTFTECDLSEAHPRLYPKVG